MSDMVEIDTGAISAGEIIAALVQEKEELARDVDEISVLLDRERDKVDELRVQIAEREKAYKQCENYLRETEAKLQAAVAISRLDDQVAKYKTVNERQAEAITRLNAMIDNAVVVLRGGA